MQQGRSDSRVKMLLGTSMQNTRLWRPQTLHQPVIPVSAASSLVFLFKFPHPKRSASPKHLNERTEEIVIPRGRMGEANTTNILTRVMASSLDGSCCVC